MSKNFELLQEIGGDDELFQTLGPLEDSLSTVDAEPNEELDEAAREEVRRTSTLPSVWETADAPTATSTRNASVQPVTPDERVKGQPSEKKTSGPENATVREPGSRIGRQARLSERTVRHTEVLRTEAGQSREKVSLDPQVQANRAKIFDAEWAPEIEKRQPQEIAKQREAEATQEARVAARAPRGKRPRPAQNTFFGSDLATVATEEDLKLVQRLFPEAHEGRPKMALFSGLGSKDGSGRICARTAELLAMRGEGPVCIVDANFQSPSVHRYFGAENVKGLLEAAVETDPIQYYVQQIPGLELWLLSTGRSPEEVGFSLVADGLKARIEELRTSFEYIVIHAGPLRLETSAMLISRWTDGVVLVVEANATRRELAKKVKESLQAANVKLLGVVLNNRAFPVPEAIYRRL